MEPYNFYKVFIGLKKNKRLMLPFSQNQRNQRSLKRLRYDSGNFFIPDARKIWVKPSLKYLTAYLKQNRVDAIIQQASA